MAAREVGPLLTTECVRRWAFSWSWLCAVTRRYSLARTPRWNVGLRPEAEQFALRSAFRSFSGGSVRPQRLMDAALTRATQEAGPPEQGVARSILPAASALAQEYAIRWGLLG